MIYLFLAEGFEEIEALTPVDYLRRAGLDVTTVSITDNKSVIGSHGITVVADTTIDRIALNDDIEMIILPGGMPGTTNLQACEQLNKAIDYCAANERYLSAICAAPMILGQKGLLDKKAATCYNGYEVHLKGANVTRNGVEIDGRIITASSVHYSNEFAFAIIQTLLGSAAVDKLKSAILY